MELTINDVLSESDLGELLKSDVEYANLVSAYQKISMAKLELISSQKTSFLSLLARGKPPASALGRFGSPTVLRDRVYDVLAQKITVGLMAIDKIPLKDVASAILRMDATFVSPAIILHVCSNNPDSFSIKQTKQGKLLHLGKQSPAKNPAARKTGKEAKSTSKTLLSESERTAAQLKFLCKSRPDVLSALSSDTDWKTILAAYRFWQDNCKADKKSTYVSWLLKMAKAHFPSRYHRYEDSLFTMLVSCVVKYLSSCEKSLKDVTEHICLDKPSFISGNQVREIILLNSDHVRITKNTKNMPMSEQMVSLASGECVTDGDSSMCLPAQMESRIKPLLSTRTHWESIISAFKIVIKSKCIADLVAKYGCFYNFLIEYGKFTKPKLLTADFKGHLQKLVQQKLVNCLSGMPQQQGKVDAVINKMGARGLLDGHFVEDTARAYGGELVLLAEDKIAISDPTNLREDPMADLESPRVLQLLAKEPHFLEVLEVFRTLPDQSLSVLSQNSMSFFEWLINLSKRLMPHDAALFELHMQGVIQREVLALHSTRRCQMTIHHLHSQLCNQHPMLLSPNFLGFCLDQPCSAFCVYQSWVYLKTATPQRKASVDVETPGSSKINPSEPFLTRVLSVIRDNAGMSGLIHAIKNVPSDEVGLILQSEMYWYDFLENNIKDRKERQRLTDLLAEEAKKCLGVNILHMKDLIALLSNGVANFVSAEALEYVIMQRRDCFAISSASYEDARVGLVRDMNSNSVECQNEAEDALMRQILLYFPSSGSSHISTLMAAISKGDSFLYKESGAPTEEYLKCFFMMFPMLFYIRDEVVVLTCTALEKRYISLYNAALFPTSTTDVESTSAGNTDKGQRRRHGRPRKRTHSGSRRRSSGSSSGKHRKHKRSESPVERSAPSPIEIKDDGDSGQEASTSAEIVIDDDSSDSLGIFIDEEIGNEDYENTKQVVEELPDGLIADVTANLLLTIQNPTKVAPLMKELVSMVVGSDDVQRIEESEKLRHLLEQKTLNALKEQSSRFNLVHDASCPDKVVQIGILDQEPSMTNLPKSNVDEKAPVKVKQEKIDSSSIQQVEVASTSSVVWKIDPVIYEISDSSDDEQDQSTTAPGNDDVIKLPPEVDSKNSEKNIDDAKGNTEASSAAVSLPEPVEKRASVPQYSAKSASASYLKPAEKPVHHAKQHQLICARDEQLMNFFRGYFKVNAGSCSTELLIASAHRRFCEERFARSRLAFEAYVYDFTLRHFSEFVLCGRGCEFGVSWIQHRRGSLSSSPLVAEPTNLSFLKLIPGVCKACSLHLWSRANTQASFDDVCELISSEFRDHLDTFSDTEVLGVVRCLVLVAMIRNLKLFCFGVDSPVVYMRDRRRKPSGDKDVGTHQKYKFEMENIAQNASLTEALLLMANLLRSGRPISKSALRSLWQTKAPSKLAKVFGTGISFTLSLRKYDFLFPTSGDGSVEVNEDAIRNLESRFRGRKAS